MKKLAILIAAIALVCFSVPAMAVDWNFYGSARMQTYYTSQNNPSGTDVDGLKYSLQGNSRFGAKIKAEAVNAQIEMGISSAGGGGNVSARRVYATWNFGAGKLKVGKDYTPIDQFISGQVLTPTSVCWVPAPSTAAAGPNSPWRSAVSKLLLVNWKAA